MQSPDEIPVTEAMIEVGAAAVKLDLLARTGGQLPPELVVSAAEAAYRAMFALDPTVGALRAEVETLCNAVAALGAHAIEERERARLQGWTEAAKRLQDVANMHGDPVRASHLYADAEILLAVNGKRDAVQPETPAQIAAQAQGDPGDETSSASDTPAKD